jgi:hypothetical protein
LTLSLMLFNIKFDVTVFDVTVFDVICLYQMALAVFFLESILFNKCCPKKLVLNLLTLTNFSSDQINILLYLFEVMQCQGI